MKSQTLFALPRSRQLFTKSWTASQHGHWAMPMHVRSHSIQNLMTRWNIMDKLWLKKSFEFDDPVVLKALSFYFYWCSQHQCRFRRFVNFVDRTEARQGQSTVVLKITQLNLSDHTYKILHTSIGFVSGTNFFETYWA